MNEDLSEADKYDGEDYTVSTFTIQINHLLNEDRDKLGEDIAKAIDANENLHTMLVTSDCTLYHHFQE